MSEKKKLGIIGGMGSVAGAYMFDRMTELTPATTDQDYIETFVHNNSSIPDRTQGILYGGESPVPQLKRSVKIMNDMGADYIVFACMTSHYFIPELQKESKAVLLDAIEETVQVCVKDLPDVKKVGVLASTGNIKLGLFQKKLEARGIEPVVFNDKDQQYYFMDPIYLPWGIKAGNVTGKPKERFQDAIKRLKELGAEAVIAGCSELPLVLSQSEVDVPLIDSIDALCLTSIEKCLGVRPQPAVAR